MKDILKQASAEELDKLWRAMYEVKTIIHKIAEIEKPIEILEYYKEHTFAYEVMRFLTEIMKEETRRGI